MSGFRHDARVTSDASRFNPYRTNSGTQLPPRFGTRQDVPGCMSMWVGGGEGCVPPAPPRPSSPLCGSGGYRDGTTDSLHIIFTPQSFSFSSLLDPPGSGHSQPPSHLFSRSKILFRFHACMELHLQFTYTSKQPLNGSIGFRHSQPYRLHHNFDSVHRLNCIFTELCLTSATQTELWTSLTMDSFF